VVRDRGPGLPETFGLQSGRTLGLQIVRALLRQVKGTLTPRTEGGAVFELRVPVAGPLRVEAPSLGVGPVRHVSPGR
jgi:two-component sensor histidine kinase